MPRIKPTTKVDVIGALDLSPEEAVGDYLASKRQDAFVVKPPNADSAGDSVELLFIRNGREHANLLRLQEELLVNARRQAQLNASRTKKLYKSQAHLRKRFIDVNNFLKDCADKKRVAEKKVADEIAKHEELEENIEQHKDWIDDLTNFRQVLKETVTEFEPYEKILKDVVENSEIYDSVKDCMDRCDALMLAQVEITTLEQQKLNEIEEMRKKMVQITNEAALTILGLKNELAELERSYSIARNECLKWERILDNAKECVARNDFNRDRALDGINQTYRMLCKRRNMEPVFEAIRDVEEQLDFIKTEVEILTECERECIRQTTKKTDRTVVTEKAGTYC